ncbi:GNAT family N-acetyltransferase [Nocardia altamirensis]|uniref:GNAT family N-acetyltransferase n=1 Tax=Nocardia altamirensis TaxID=472158 RepID=UPI0009FBFC46|nr:GNAT family N-acetyltransferase [Nocardia altamirensis]
MSHLPRFNDPVEASLSARDFDHPDSVRLLCDYARERRVLVGFDDPPNLDKPSEYQPPRGLFVIAYTEPEIPIACGGIRTYRDRKGVFEIRKMYVAPQYRRQGVARRILLRLEQHASTQGAHELLLETGSYNQAAIRLYTSSVYRPIPPYVQGRPSFNRAFAKDCRIPAGDAATGYSAFDE